MSGWRRRFPGVPGLSTAGDASRASVTAECPDAIPEEYAVVLGPRISVSHGIAVMVGTAPDPIPAADR